MLRNRKTEKLCIGFTIMKLFLVLTDMLPVKAASETPEGDHIGSCDPLFRWDFDTFAGEHAPQQGLQKPGVFLLPLL